MKKNTLFAILLLAAGLILSGCARKTIVTEPPARRPAAPAKPKPATKPAKKPAPKPAPEIDSGTPEDQLPLKAVEPGLLYIQVGAFSDERGASQVRDALLELGYKGSRMAKDPDDGYYRVQAGVFPDMECAQRALKKLMEKHPESFIISDQ
ncbi:SPOR domain-containing protein [Pseudodesulfovibrio senegalensis]|jgi:DedD protein|nr:SPOR domain-containing protein [Pseudodesulfovibrio senegalensis]